jgi:hypothetical protein
MQKKSYEDLRNWPAMRNKIWIVVSWKDIYDPIGFIFLLI